MCQNTQSINRWYFCSEKLRSDVASEHSEPALARTRQVVSGVMERLNLLLQVTIAVDTRCNVGISRSISHMPQQGGKLDMRYDRFKAVVWLLEIKQFL